MEFHDFFAAQIRIARPTDKFDEVIEFYEKGIGLKRITEFTGHRGYTGVILGLPEITYQLEFTKHVDGSPCPAPTKDNLLVFYIPVQKEIISIVKRLQDMGCYEVDPENGYWKEKGITIEDPDGWRVVLMNTNGI
ncbi:MAG: VOC family protein [Bacillota bacterium]|uniref:VOC family protein n=1 Tax=Virgibacillus salarius TaxID=447199 RepID=A0A941I9R0_9BACI|nr:MULTISPECIES: VOC family protein [Bacillaceae]NAZ07303.1 VOC family protein [Agaribacter marinus]MBR7794581.1 VOC family protein [Virgibacillus salarius]MCC2252462.1 VOC family protein [Virgibacillus sp. AGTR]MDY7045480.1 VOC family protein [Virgibacillus sp. M23]QRZ16325.1 VOC family protein [Virgibacillus sp. AGTR]